MRRLRRLDLALLGALTPLWLLAVVLHVPRALEGRIGWVPLLVAPETGEAPRLHEFLAQYDRSQTLLEPGDRLLRVGDQDLRGTSRAGFTAAVWKAVGPDLRFPVTAQRGSRVLEERVPLQRVPEPARNLPFILAFGVGAILILWRGHGTPTARAFYLAGMCHSLQWASFFGPVAWQSYLSLAVALLATLVVFPLTLRALALVAGRTDADAPWRPLWIWPFLALGPATSSWLLGWPAPSGLGLAAILVLNLLLIALGLLVLTRGFLAAGGAVRRKIKWVVLGFYLGLVPVLFGAAVAAVDPSLVWVHEIAAAFTVFIPICCLMAVVRDDFLDIDRLLTETAAYSAAGVLLLGVLVQVLPVASRAFARSAGMEPESAQVLLFIAGVGGAVPLRRVLRPRLESFFFRERRRVERELARLRRDLARPGDPGKLFELLGEGLGRILQPDGCVIYVRSGDLFGPVFVRGASAPPAFEASGALLTLLEEQEAPVPAARWRRWLARGAVPEEAAAALETLSPALLLPLPGEEGLLGFVCLGPRLSGELYGDPEAGWLGAVAERAAAELRQVGAAELIEHARELRARLRRYVPGAVAETIEHGEELSAGEREVTVLFVDVRGYTSYSESRGAAEIFETVSLYTEAASEVVLRHGGSVVEFHGDGLMAVFGAPRELPRKEQAAVLAARDIALAVPRLQVEGATLEVGVGIATGPAFVGNIRAVDRVIWGAIGNTTNLAARLQSMTRDIEASVALEAVTHARAGEAAEGFEDRGALSVRGRSEPIRVFALPLSPGEAA